MIHVFTSATYSLSSTGPLWRIGKTIIFLIISKSDMASSNQSYVLESDVTTTYSNVSHVFERHTWGDFLSIHCPGALLVDRSVTPIWYVIGITGNVLSASVWMQRRMRQNNSSAVYLATLSITDLFFLLLHILQELRYAWGVPALSRPGLCETYFLMSLAAQYLSPLLVLGFTVERYIAVCHPFKKGKFCTIRRATRVCVALVALSMSLSGIQAYFWTYDHVAKDCTVRAQAMAGGSSSVWAVWTWVSEMLTFLLVPVIILVFNVLVIREVRHLSRTGRNLLPSNSSGRGSGGSTGAATTLMLLSVSFYVICTTLPATLVYALAEQFPEGDPYLTDVQIQQDAAWHSYLSYLMGRKVVEELCLSHYACNFLLYLITGVHFRRAVVHTLHLQTCLPMSANVTSSDITQKTTIAYNTTKVWSTCTSKKTCFVEAVKL